NVVVHQAVRETAPSSFLDREPEQAQVRPAIGIVEIDRLLGIPTRIDVVDPTLDLFAGSPRHKRSRPPRQILSPTRSKSPQLKGSDPLSRRDLRGLTPLVVYS